MLIKYHSNSHKPIQQTFLPLGVHQYALIEQSAICHDVLYYSNRVLINRSYTESFDSNLRIIIASYIADYLATI